MLCFCEIYFKTQAAVILSYLERAEALRWTGRGHEDTDRNSVLVWRIANDGADRHTVPTTFSEINKVA